MVPSRQKGIAWSQPKKLPSSYWKNLKINLASAHLFDMDFTLCVLADVNFANACFAGEIRFGRTRFEEICSFDGAKFYGAASFRFVVFNAEASFDNADFRQKADFYQARFGMHGSFDEVRFRGDAIFDQAEFSMGAFLGKRSLMLLLSSVKPSLGDQIGLMLHNSMEASRTSLALRFVSQIVISTGPLTGKSNYRSKRTTFLGSSAARVNLIRYFLVTARTVQGMARVRSGQAPAWPLVLTGVSAEAPGSSVTSRVRWPVLSTCAGCPAGTVALEAGGADTYTQRAIPGSDLFRVRSPPRLGSRASSQVAMPAVLSGSCRGAARFPDFVEYPVRIALPSNLVRIHKGDLDRNRVYVLDVVGRK